MASVTESNKYRKLMREYQYMLFHEQDINKSKIARKYGLTLQCLNNWIIRYNWNDLTCYIDVPAIIAQNEVRDRSNSKYTQDIIESMFFYSSAVNENGELKYKTKESIREMLELSKSTFAKYLTKKEFEQAYIEGRKAADKEIKKFKLEDALYKVALGEIKTRTKKIEDVYSKDGYVGEKKTKIVVENAPNVKALELSLNKFAPGEYDKKPLKETKELPKQIDWEKITPEQAKALAEGNFDVLKGDN
ncbi:MAG: hypothetical protein JXM74_04640 [Fusobacteriaceae bacterium]|nr:hypothetical protein [Fusobacteriaceae bacterium]MBN2838023.1 hypothetical protein [Fusobacteriaceae bacterium]